jgi:hypothetical protein
MKKWRILPVKVFHSLLACLPGLLAVPLLAQPQIGGGTCSSATLSGNYSATLTGRDLNSSVTFSNTTQGIGSVNFDGLSKVTFTLSTNTNKIAGTAQTLSGTYSLQANCVGVLTITSGDQASFTLEAYSTGKDYLITGQDGTYAFTGSGGVLPATCPTSLSAGTYVVNGSGFGLTSTAISSVNNFLGVIQLSGTNTIASAISISTNGGTTNSSGTGTYTLSPNCSATATLTSASGGTQVVVFEFTTASGGNFIFSLASLAVVSSGSGRSL